MPDKEPKFTVMDRRKFTLEGDLRNDETSGAEQDAAKPDTAKPGLAEPETSNPAPPESVASPEPAAPQEPAPAAEEFAGPTPEENARQSEDYQASTRQLDDLVRQANPGQTAAAPMDFDRLVQSIYMTAMLQMGAGAAPNEQPRIDILGARQSIDMLAVLEEKTRGNLTDPEKRLLQGALFELRMAFLEIANAIASSAHQAPKPGAKR
ncbi:MAG TPA: DUF1844 domain-containing protein [Acidobacteriaceae bacterium]|nr:DUF1844 domain-containing protein [Acidobacteriaceae bacterium]